MSERYFEHEAMQNMAEMFEALHNDNASLFGGIEDSDLKRIGGILVNMNFLQGKLLVGIARMAFQMMHDLDAVEREIGNDDH